MRGQRAERTEFTQTGSAQPTAMPVKHLQHPFLYISQQPKKKEGNGKDKGTGRPDPVNSRAAQQQEKATALPADKKTITSSGVFLSACCNRETKN